MHIVATRRGEGVSPATVLSTGLRTDRVALKVFQGETGLLAGVGSKDADNADDSAGAGDDKDMRVSGPIRTKDADDGRILLATVAGLGGEMRDLAVSQNPPRHSILDTTATTARQRHNSIDGNNALQKKAADRGNVQCTFSRCIINPEVD